MGQGKDDDDILNLWMGWEQDVRMTHLHASLFIIHLLIS